MQKLNPATRGVLLRTFRYFRWLTIAVLAIASNVLHAGPATSAPGLSNRPINLTCVAPNRPPSGASIALEQVADLPDTYGPATVMRQAPGDASRWYVGYANGAVEVWQAGDPWTSLGLAIDIRDRVTTTFRGTLTFGVGLIGMTFHPDFQNNGQLFLYYGYAPTDDPPPVFMRLSRFTSADGGLTFDATNEDILFSLEQFKRDHKAGNLEFGSDGFLYITTGEDNTPALSQDPNSLKGKMLRIDVDSGTPYGIPAGNPFALGGGLPEIYAWGLRNPWRWSFDRESGDLWLGDVGFTQWEEVNQIQLGGNYGWPAFEGNTCIAEPEDCANPDFIGPVVQFPNAGPTAVIGGYVYRGSAIPELQGTYVFADGRKSIVYALVYDEQGQAQIEELLDDAPLINTFSEAHDGELYVASPVPSLVLRIVRQGEAHGSEFPQTLSATGCMDPNDVKQPAAGLIPYDVSSPLWSDGATKRRFIALPDWSVPDTKVSIQPDGDFDFPVNTVLVKEFSLANAIIETRLLVRHEDGEWAGYSYEWNDEQTEAHLLPAGKSKVVGAQTWTFPSRNQCLQCHTSASGRSLGVELAQQNSDFTYPSTGLTANQLETLDHIGVFAGGLPGPANTLDRLPPPDDSSEPLQARARGYLHSNCSMCHRPGGLGQGPADFRHYVTLEEMGVVGVDPTQGDLGVAGAKLVAPGDASRSVVSLRMHSLGLSRMPALGTSLVDPLGTSAIDQWIDAGIDTDEDGVPDLADNCVDVFNPIPGTHGSPAKEGFQTTTGGQIDDDADGFGNACDADFDNQGAVVAGTDLLEQFASFNKDRAGNDCGISGNQVCSKFDLDNRGRFIGGFDLTAARQHFGLAPGPKCDACPLACVGDGC